jgi:hypothetical protein
MAPSSRVTSRCAAARTCAPASQRAPRCSFGGALGGPAAKSDRLCGWFPTDSCAPSACVPATPPPPYLCFFPLLACRFPVVALSRALPLRSVPWPGVRGCTSCTAFGQAPHPCNCQRHDDCAGHHRACLRRVRQREFPSPVPLSVQRFPIGMHDAAQCTRTHLSAPGIGTSNRARA